MAGMIWVFGILNITLPFFLMAASFRSMDPALEEAGRASGMGGLSTFWHVNLKLMIPTIFAVLLLLVVRGIETFEVPAVIGLPAEIKVYASEIFLALRMYQPPDYNLAGTYSTFYLVVASVGVALYLKATSASEKYATITGKGYRPRTQRLGRWRYLTLLLSSLILFVGVILPFLVVALTSVLPIYQRPSRELLSALTLENYRTVLGLELFYQALVNNVVVGVLSATAAGVLATAVAWVVVRTGLRGRKLLDVVAFTPMAFPGIVIGLALLWMYLTLPIPVYGTLWILVIAGLRDEICSHRAARLPHRAVAAPSGTGRGIRDLRLVMAQDFRAHRVAVDSSRRGRGLVLCFGADFQSAVAAGFTQPSGHGSAPGGDLRLL